MIATSIEQSKRLVELGLDISTADMYWEEEINITKIVVGNYSLHMQCMQDKDYKKHSNPVISPAWSLTALLELMPELDGRNPELNRIINTNKWWMLYHSTASLSLIRTKECDNPLDSAFEMICWLLKNNKL